MPMKHYFGVAFAILVVCLFTLKLYNSSKFSSVMIPHNYSRDNQGVSDYIRQRNNISRLLNLKQKLIGQMECEKTKAGTGTSNTGGWCETSSKEHSGYHVTDKPLVPALAELFKGKYVASFGDGPGRYKQLLLETGKLNGYDAYDGAPFTETTSEGRVVFLDLTLPQYGLPLYDWIISLEVAEHIPNQYESAFISNIVRHAKEGVVLSWAVPGQGGHAHVNNRPLEYVVSLMESFGFKHDKSGSEKLKNAATLPWLKSNTNVYRRRLTDEELENMYPNA